MDLTKEKNQLKISEEKFKINQNSEITVQKLLAEKDHLCKIINEKS